MAKAEGDSSVCVGIIDGCVDLSLPCFAGSSLTEQRVKEENTAQSFFTVCRSAPESLEQQGRAFASPGDELWRITAHAAIMTDADYT